MILTICVSRTALSLLRRSESSLPLSLSVTYKRWIYGFNTGLKNMQPKCFTKYLRISMSISLLHYILRYQNDDIVFPKYGLFEFLYETIEILSAKHSKTWTLRPIYCNQKDPICMGSFGIKNMAHKLLVKGWALVVYNDVVKKLMWLLKMEENRLLTFVKEN
ncbi:hypothetical protein LXL04_019043 [Taraxacum kok-saghyz]